IAKVRIPDNKKYIGLDDERSTSYSTGQLLAESFILDAFESTPRANMSAAVLVDWCIPILSFDNALHNELRTIAKTTYSHVRDTMTMVRHLDMFLNEQDNPS
ncbi:hypothetical protein FOL46_002845, partial [Perkinsus olseni]